MQQTILRPVAAQATAVSTATTQVLAPLATTSDADVGGCTHLVLIVPHEEGERQAEAMAGWFQACASDQPFTLELVGTKREQRFVLRASSEAQLGMLCKQMAAQYPQAEIERIDAHADPLLLQPGEVALTGDFALAQHSMYPLKTFSGFGGKELIEQGADPTSGLLAAMEAVGSGERIVCQLSLVRAPDSWIRPSLRKAVEPPLQHERDAALAIRSQSGSDVERGKRLLFGMFAVLALLSGYRWYQQQAWLSLSLLVGFCLVVAAGLIWWQVHHRHDIYDMKLVAEKLARSAFYMHLRVVVVGHSSTRAKEATLRSHLTAMEVAYRQYSLANANSLNLKRMRTLQAGDPRAHTLCRADDAFADRSLLMRLFARGAWSRDICNVLELPGLFHLPQEFTDLPLVRRLAVKHLLFSPEVSHAIAQQRGGALPPVKIGVSKHRGYAINVLLPSLTQFAHKCFVGKSGSGKSALLQLLIAGVMRRVRDGSPQPGIFVIDPHRDLIFDILKLVPRHRAKDVLLLDFTNLDAIVGLNPLDATMGLSRDQMIASLMSCFERIWEKYWGPRMSHFLKNICLLLITLNFELCAQGLADEQYTLLDINPVLQYKEYAILVLDQLNRQETWHQELLAWFQHTYWTLPEKSNFRQEIILPILSKMSIFSDNQQLRRIFGQSITTAPVHTAITKGKIVLCALSSRDMDESSVNILGSTLINLLHYGFTRQQDIPTQQRRKCAVFIDELQNFSGSAFDKLSSEDRKWGCAAHFTTQNLKRLNQIKDGLQEMLLTNCDALFTFNVSAADAKILEEEFQEKVSQKHIISQPRLHCYGRMSIEDYPQQFASIQLSQPASWGTASPARQALADQIVRVHHRLFKSAAECDRQHEEHLRHFLDVSIFADRIEKDAEAIEKQRDKREAEARRVAELLDDVEKYTASAPVAQDASSRSSATSPQQVQQEAHPQSSTAPLSVPTEATVGGGGGGGQEKGHKSKRSRRMNKFKHKSPVGAPPPGLTPTGATEESSDDQRPLPSLLHNTSSQWGTEGRERERGA